MGTDELKKLPMFRLMGTSLTELKDGQSMIFDSVIGERKFKKSYDLYPHQFYIKQFVSFTKLRVHDPRTPGKKYDIEYQYFLPNETLVKLFMKLAEWEVTNSVEDQKEVQ